MQYKKFSYKTLDDLKREIADNNLNLDVLEDTSILKNEVKIAQKTAPNSLAIHPMEGCDANSDGTPGELTLRRYTRFAEGGAGLLWMEAVAVVPEGRANPRHLWINENNKDSFKAMSDIVNEKAYKKNGYKPLTIVQLTHAGRFSRPVDKPAPVIAYHNPYLNQKFDIPVSHPVITDSRLEALEDEFVRAAMLSKEAGFSGVDIKGCHRYLVSELFSAYNREGKYGGSFENRTRFILNVIKKVKAAVGDDFIIASRLNIYDGIPYPYGWATDRNDFTKPDLTEPMKIIGLMEKAGVSLINITMGTPYYNPHVNRPYDAGGYIPEEGQIEGVARLINGAGEVQKAYPRIAFVGTGYSWLRHMAANVAAGTVKSGKAKIIGMGRGAFAYPDFPSDIINKGQMEKSKSCLACTKCTELMRAHSVTGCIVRDNEVYAPLYVKNCVKKD